MKPTRAASSGAPSYSRKETSMTLATRPAPISINTIDELARISDMFAKSGLFTDAKDAAQAGVKIMAGQSWGIDPFNAMSGIFIIKGKPTISAGLMAAAVKGHPKYDYRVRTRTDQRCAIEYFQGTESLGISEYTMDMAKRAGLTGNDTWRKHPEAMLFARAMSAGVRTFVPDVFTSSVYTPEELGATIDEDGTVIDIPSTPNTTFEATQITYTDTPEAQEAITEIEVALDPAPTPAPVPPPAPPRPPKPTPAPAPAAANNTDAITDKQLQFLGKKIKRYGLSAPSAREFFAYITQRPITNANDLTKREASTVLDWTDDQWQEQLVKFADKLNMVNA